MKIVVRNISDCVQTIQAHVANASGNVEDTSFSIMPKAVAELEAVRFFGIDYPPDLSRKSLVLISRQGDPPPAPQGEPEQQVIALAPAAPQEAQAPQETTRPNRDKSASK